MVQVARRIELLTTGIFSVMEAKKREVEARGLPVINLGIGSPDRPPAPHIKAALRAGIEKDVNYRYPVFEGCLELRQAIARWYQRRFDVELDPEREVLVLMGSQDGLAHLAWAYIEAGDLALVPDPGYPIYSASILLAGGELYPLPLKEENGFLPRLEDIPAEVARRAKLLTLNYPSNPVAAVADRAFFRQAVEFARQYDLLVCHDAAYSELAFDGFKPMSFLEVPGAREVGVEFHSCSKSFNMAGCRIGFVVGNQEVIANLNKIKSNIDYGVFSAVQEAAIAALEGPQDFVRENAATYQKRRDVLVEGLAEAGWQIPKPKGSMFLWARIPAGFSTSMEFALTLLEKAGVLMIPGHAFGAQGEGYVRIALTQEVPLLQEAVARIKANFHF
ncbi:LL-diaminopimelate aminotransferase [Carboxydocella sp. JDF658]|uniref:LL-diaminopimelate aminotransferase n=1 Tax=Carboxydocella sp. JDF658 TaxID=1926600 RepID=UPI0009AE3F4D|nr:LL-diaminopimelate aminotransferase [Carboxydocella sp. JDF658]GAW31922.1 aminotransferase [Carboxydocella sp. JDF658]